MVNDKRGSVWKKFDLHLHTPDSHDYKDKSVAESQIIDKLYQQGVRLAVVSDHNVINPERIRLLQKLGRDKNITILPGIELCSDSRGNDPIHFIGIFPEDCNLTHISSELLVKSGLNSRLYAGAKINQLYCNLVETSKIIRSLGGLVSIHAGSKSNSIEEITHALPPSLANKVDIASSIDIFEVASLQDVESYKEKVLPSIKRDIPLVVGSDNHNINDYRFKNDLNCWIKADATFNGLVQIKYEPSERVRIQSHNPYQDDSRYVVDSISFDGSRVVATQFVELNKGLIGVIGGKGSGKSFLLSAISSATHGYEPHEALIGDESTKASLTLMDKNSEPHVLQIKDLSKIDYLNEPILYIKQEELALISKNKEKVRGEYLKELGILDSSLGYEHITDAVDRLLSQIEDKNDSIEEIKKKSEFTDSNARGQKLSEFLQDRILKLKDTIQKTSSKDTKEVIEQLVKMLGTNRKYRVWLENPGFTQIVNQVSELNEIIDTFNKRVADIGSPMQLTKIDLSPITEEFERIKDSIALALKSNEQAYMSSQAKLKEKDITEDVPVLLKSLEGSQNELVQFEQFAKDYVALKGDISVKRKELTNFFDVKDGEIHKTLQQRIRYVDEKYKEFCRSRSESEVFSHMFDGLSVKASIFFNHKKLLKDIEQCFYSGKSGNLYDMVFGKNEPSYEGYLTWVHEEFWEFYDYSLSNGNLMTRLDGLKVNGRTRLLEVVFFEWHEYVNVSTSIEHNFGGSVKEISKMSTGELATVLLKLRLATSGLNKQIILLDQPEDHLDNSFIAHGLVDLLKILKKSKQVVIATHNANLIVGSDAEQIIVAKDINQQYESGSIENPSIRHQIISILEGGQDAFDRRSNRYSNQIVM